MVIVRIKGGDVITEGEGSTSNMGVAVGKVGKERSELVLAEERLRVESTWLKRVNIEH